jgi:hypothetical protein
MGPVLPVQAASVIAQSALARWFFMLMLGD